MIFLQFASLLYFEATEQMHDFISKSLIFRVQIFAKVEGWFSWSFMLNQIFKKLIKKRFEQKKLSKI